VRGLERAVRDLQAELGEVLAVHTRGRDPAEFAKWADDLIGFAEGFLGLTLTDYQRTWLLSVRDNALTAIQSCNGAGKDFLAGVVALWWVYCRGGLCLITGPTLRQVREIVMGELARLFHRAEDLPGELFATALRVGQGGTAGVLAFTSGEASRLTGFHAPRVLVIITEAQGVEAHCYEAALACAVSEDDRLLVLGNPLSPTGDFYRVCHSPAWSVHKVSAFDIPNVQERKVVIPGMMTVQGVERIEAEYGKGSGIYASRVLGEFPEESEYGLIRRSWLEAAAERFESGEFAQESASAEPIMAIDPARFGPDMTVCAVRSGPVLTELIPWSKLDTSETAERVKVEAERVGIRPGIRVENPHNEQWSWRIQPYGRLVVDEVGIGAGVHDMLNTNDWVGPTSQRSWRVHGFNSSRKPAYEPRKFVNARAAAYWKLRKLLEDGKIAIQRDAKLWDELCDIRWSVASEGKIQLEGKEQLKSRLGRSPDRADAVAMAFSDDHLSREARFVTFRI
jgi:hypothetical protein